MNRRNNIDSTDSDDFSYLQSEYGRFICTSEYARWIDVKYPEISGDFIRFLSDENVLSAPEEHRKKIIREYFDRSFSDTAKRLETEKEEQLFLKILQVMKHRMIMESAFLDYLKLSGQEEICAGFSKLADFCIGVLMTFLCRQQQLNPEVIAGKICLWSMGKLGGYELNLSSDIDLIFFADDEWLVSDAEKKISRLIGKFKEMMEQRSEDGFLYRVDLRLRPEGVSGPLIMGEKKAIDYYLNKAWQWELQALLRRRLSWGSTEIDERMNSYLNRLIYEEQEKTDLVGRIRRMKDDIEKKIRFSKDHLNIKISPGGIRDIEFIVQFLQLVHGRRYPTLKTANTFRLLRTLRGLDLISVGEYRLLDEDYRYFRRVENVSQFWNNRPLKKIWKDKEKIRQLFIPWRFLDDSVEDASLFMDDLIMRMNRVRNLFESLFDETILYFYQKEQALKAFSQEKEKEYVRNHFDRLDGEYFRIYSLPDILRHIRMIMSLNSDNLCAVEKEKIKDGLWSLQVAAFDYYYEFSKIAGLLAGEGIEIVEGGSFTYCDSKAVKFQDGSKFYRRKRRRIGSKSFPLYDPLSLLTRRKIICDLKVRLKNGDFPDWNHFTGRLSVILHYLEERNHQEADAYLNSMVYTEKRFSASGKHYSIPVDVKIDNQAHPDLTVLEVRSEDHFAFLYSFTSILARQNVYIQKIRIGTENDQISDKLFIMNSAGGKIEDPEQLLKIRFIMSMIRPFEFVITQSADPSRALSFYYELLNDIFSDGETESIEILNKSVIQKRLAYLFGLSEYLWEDFIRIHFREWFPLISDDHELKRKTKAVICSELKNLSLNPQKLDSTGFRNQLIDYRHRELFRIDLRHLFHRTNFRRFAIEISELSEAVLERAFRRAESEMNHSGDWNLWALGKLGGREMGYASDIEFMFIYHSADRPGSELKEHFEQLIRKVLDYLPAKKEGIFEIDLNLRPYGKSGPLAVSYDLFRRYYSEKGGSQWFEKQSLTRMRFLFGNGNSAELRRNIQNHLDFFLHQVADFSIDELNKIREMQIQHYIPKDAWINLKYSRGCLVDIEYLAQLFRIFYGRENSGFKKQSILSILKASYKADILTDEEYKILKKTAVFYRNLINVMRMKRGNAKDLNVYSKDSSRYRSLISRCRSVGLISQDEDLMNKLENMRDRINQICQEKINKLV